MLRMRPLSNRPVAGHRPGMGQQRGRVLQRQIVAPGGLGGLHGQSQELTSIVNQVNRYNRVINALTGEQRLLLMSTLRGHLYNWLVANPLHPDRDVILDLMNQVRAEHQRQTVLLQAGGNIYVRSDPQNDAQMLWTQLVNNIGSVIIENRDYGQLIVNGANVQIAGFRDRVLSAFATLLERPEGQKLVRKLLNSPQTVRIVPMTITTRQALTQLQQGVVMNRNVQPGVRGFRIGNAPVVVPPVHAGQSPGVTFADPVPFIGMGGFNVNAYIGAVAGTKANIDIQTGAVLPQFGGGAPQGSAAIVAIEPNLDDADVFSLNAHGGGPLITPLFLTLAHELLHAKRMMRGRSRTGPAPIPAFNNAEEYRAITGGNTSENSLRAAYGIGTRFGHAGALRAQLPPAIPGQLVLYQPPPMVGGGQLVPYQPPPQVPQQMAFVPYQPPDNGQIVPYVAPPPAPQQLALVPYQPQQMALVPYRPPVARQPLAIMPPPQQLMLEWH
ncbi:M91 family zinc metallopeptidase [Oceanibaculum indicum]|uniref:NleD-like pathogen effector protein (Putative zinc metallopeptidase) n=1 Tax=Oceanibaculum indicum TaxID=526216 RepID=A0A420WQ15_9PROT|nr:M91 family zinc metallopeptidase [Oceanibaculum indicum]RKQ72952.1 NleD-like pathogen effector protein (putative zinc metallopeptidase) [Oceanibaculum indicum]